MAASKKKIIGRTQPWSRTIHGEPASKANSRKLVTIGGKTRFIKSDKARAYVEAFAYQCPALDPMFEEDVCVEMVIYYASRRPDLDESLILDALQGRVYRNDRQVRRKIIEWALDPENPRTDIRVCPLA
jgi:Holliday junction resolvase RusA-like endonuclease